jgi:uncharacterized protein YndB with AHSA1/START domain
MEKEFQKKICIDSNIEAVWQALTSIEKMKEWMAEKEMKLEIITNWEIDGTIKFKGFHHVYFENIGKVLKYEENKLLVYSHLSSISNLENINSNYTIIQFKLEKSLNQTNLELNISNCPNVVIYNHLKFYWNTSIEILKDYIEQKPKT